LADAIGQILPIAVGVAISPLPIVAVILMLVSRRGRANGPSFIVGWLVGLAVVGAIVLSLSSGAGASDGDEPATWVSVVKLVLGLLLLLVGVHGWRGRPRSADEVVTPKWMSALDTFTPPKAAGAGVLLSALNPKNLLLAVSAAAAIAGAGVATGEQVVAYAVFEIIATVGVAAPVVLFFALGDRSGEVLDKLKTWMSANNAVIMAVLMLVIGAKLIGDGIGGL
jgi:threonine/homoserine/homoserine lactone efflux protein